MGLALSSFIGGNLPLTQCPLKNISVCPSTDTSNGFSVVFYNPLSRSRREVVRIPVEMSNVKVNWKRENSQDDEIVAEKMEEKEKEKIFLEIRFIFSYFFLGLRSSGKID